MSEVLPGMTGASQASVSTRPGGILVFDLSSHVGWAYGHPNETPVCGTWHLGDPPLGRRFVKFENELIKTLGKRLPRLVVCEAPLVNHKSQQAARQQLGLAAYVDSETYRAGITCKEGHVNTVRKDVMGRGSFGDSDANKIAVMAWCNRQGWFPPDHNAGDALVLWTWSCPYFNPAPASRPLA